MISVIIPMYNSENSIEAALDSVLNQTWKGKFEIIVINDGSTDSSPEIVQKYIDAHPDWDIRLFNQQNQGVSAARNNGMKLSKGEYIALLDSDDVWLPDKIEKQMKFFDTRPEIDFLATVRNNQKLLYPYNSKSDLAEVTFKKLLIRNEITIPSVIFKRKILDNTGYFQEGQNHAEDVDFYLRISENNKMYILTESLITAGGGKRTFGESGLSANLKKMAEGYRSNLNRLYKAGRINGFQLFGYKIYYRLKYLVLLLRTSFYKLFKKQ